MSTQTRRKLVTANAVSYVVEINEVLNDDTRKGRPHNMIVPGMFDRAFLIFHEAGVLPIDESVSTPGA